MTLHIDLADAQFGVNEHVIIRNEKIAVSTFRYASGVAALRLKTARANIVVLPYKGQQIWSAEFDGRDLTMGSMFEEPVDTTDYLRTYGAFFIHCGLAGVGAPGPQDTHPLHGELPNAPYQAAWLEVDEAKNRISICGSYQHTIAFSCNYLATSKVSLDFDETWLTVDLSVENKRNVPMDLMYLGHANFRPVDFGKLIYAAQYDPASVRVRTSIPAHISPAEGYVEFIEALEREPVLHHVLRPDLAFDPEVVFSIDMMAGLDGWTHAMQKLPDGGADFISYQPAQAPLTGRWLCRTPDQQGLGIAFPATSGVEGHQKEKAKGCYVELAARDTWNITMRMGALGTAEADAMEDSINHIAGR